MIKLNFDNNETYDCYINDDEGLDLSLSECGYEKCSPLHYWEGKKKFYLFHYILNGKGTLTVNGKTYAVAAGQVFFVTPDDQIYYEADEKEPWEYIWIGFRGLATKGLLKNASLWHESVQPIKGVAKFIGIYKSIMKSSRLGNTAYILCLSYLYQFIAYILENYVRESSEWFNDDVKEQNFKKILRMITARYHDDIGIDDMAHLIGYEKTYVFRLFKERLSISPQKYVTVLRIRESMQVIKAGEQSFTAIATRAGFPDYLTFFRNFKSIAGITPSEYQDNLTHKASEKSQSKNKAIEKILDGYLKRG
ncbi:AraC family transcriptional regulator [Clostridia bacterium]|nr:AraC family transcriptional regulator [Clostridia bacterium]